MSHGRSRHDDPHAQGTPPAALPTTGAAGLFGTSGATYRPIAGFPGYRVGDDGSVWTNLKRSGYGAWQQSEEWQPKATCINKAGYVLVALYRDGKYTTFLVHRLVLESPGAHLPGRRAPSGTETLREALTELLPVAKETARVIRAGLSLERATDEQVRHQPWFCTVCHKPQA